MAKMKVHELAKELDRQSKELIAFLQEKGIDAKVAQSSIEEEAIELVRKHFKKDRQNTKKTPQNVLPTSCGGLVCSYSYSAASVVFSAVVSS